MIVPLINPNQEVKSITYFLRKTLETRGFSRLVIACSGGVDSSTTLMLAVKALGKRNIFPLLLPYKNLHAHGVKDAKMFIKKLGIPKENWEIIDIEPVVKAFIKSLALNKADVVRQGNVMARCRMIVVYDRAKKHRALVLGTENKSEFLLGYFTRFGDEASDIEVIRHLYKTQVKQLAKYLGVPKEIIDKPPTAGLWPEQTDEGELGFSYEQADPILYLLYDKRKSVKEIVKKGFSENLVRKVKAWMERNWFKHELPLVFK